MGSQPYFSFRLYGKPFYLITQLSQLAFFYRLKRNTEMYELTNWWDEWFICSASYLSEWPVLGISDMYKTHCSIQVLNNFSIGKVSSFSSYRIHCMLSRTAISNICWLYACAQLFITASYSSLQKASSAYFRLLNYFHHTHTPVIFENWGKRDCNSHFSYCCSQQEGNLHF